MISITYAIGSGILIAAGIGWIVMRYNVRVPITEGLSILPWRLQLILTQIPGCIAIGLIYAFLPESPIFLNNTGQQTRALEVLRFIYTKNGNDPQSFPIKALKDESSENAGKEL